MNPVEAGMDVEFSNKKFSIVYIPNDIEQPLAEWEFTWGDGTTVHSHLKYSTHFIWHFRSFSAAAAGRYDE